MTTNAQHVPVFLEMVSLFRKQCIVQHNDVIHNERKYIDLKKTLMVVYTDEEGKENRDEGSDEESSSPNESEEDLKYCNRTCPTVRMLRQDCRQECLVKNKDNRCPSCNRTCLQSMFVEC